MYTQDRFNMYPLCLSKIFYKFFFRIIYYVLVFTHFYSVSFTIFTTIIKLSGRLEIGLISTLYSISTVIGNIFEI